MNALWVILYMNVVIICPHFLTPRKAHPLHHSEDGLSVLVFNILFVYYLNLS